MGSQLGQLLEFHSESLQQAAPKRRQRHLRGEQHPKRMVLLDL